jgi:hypothetical protein
MGVARAQRRINVTLDEEYAIRLARMAERTHIQEGTLARSLLSRALDDADPDTDDITALLDGIPGAFESAQQGIREIRAGKGIRLEDW